MREIKFRGKRTSDSAWVIGDLNQHDIHHGTAIIQNGVINNAVIPETVGQFTGLADKNGKEIYEGDILHGIYEDRAEPTGMGHIYNEIAFKNGAFGWIGEITKDFYPFDGSEIEEEIAGNKFDNPEIIR